VAWWAVTSSWFSIETPLLAISSCLALVAFLYLMSVSVALTIIDIETFRLPNRIVLPSFVVVAVLLAGSSALRFDFTQLVRALIAGAVLLVFYFLLRLVSRGGMGLGDVKLAPTLGLALGWLSWQNLIVGAFMPFIVGGLFSVVLLLRKRVAMKTRVPFGPWMILGAWFGIVLGRTIFGFYLRLTGLAL
jgi:leader peptidase (prepilin peptidase)/N-methyltransferase